MLRALLVAALVLAGCHPSGVMADGGVVLDGGDAGEDVCPATAPDDATPCPSDGLSCTYAASICGCHGAGGLIWYCRATSCPDPSVVVTGLACGAEQAQLTCAYGFDDECTCIAPDDEWLCCGATKLATCPSPPQLPKTGDLCCGVGTSCATECDGVVPTKTLCDCHGNHLKCTVFPCGTDGGV